MTKLTAAETRSIDTAAARICGAIWQDAFESPTVSPTVRGKLEQAIAWRGGDGDARLTKADRDLLRVLLSLCDGLRYELLDEDGDIQRDATVTETIDSMMAEPERFILVDNVLCYVNY